MYDIKNEISTRETVELEELINAFEEMYSTLYHIKTANDIFVSNDDVSQQLMCYIQSKQYSSIQFDILTLPDKGLMRILNCNYPGWSKYKEVDLRVGNSIIDLPHMIVALNINRAGVAEVLDTSGISKHSGGFIGDLQQSIGHALSYSNAKSSDEFAKDVIKSVGVDIIVRPDGKDESSYFSVADLNSDLDAVNIFREYVVNNDNVVTAMQEYYTSEKHSNRGSEFIKNMSGYEEVKNEIINNIPKNDELTNEKIFTLMKIGSKDYNTMMEPRFIGVIKVCFDRAQESLDGARKLKRLYDGEKVADEFIKFIRTIK